jgi:hypothetical protein
VFTGLIIALLAIVGAATVVSGGLVVLARRTERQLAASDERRRLTDGRGEAALERGVEDVRVGDIVQRNGRDYLVEGVAEYDEDGHRWRAARLIDGRDENWLMVGLERGGNATLRWLSEDPSIDVAGYPPERITAAGIAFAQRGRGTATVRIAGDTGALASARTETPDSVLRCRWWRYEAAGTGALVVEQWGTLFRALRGTSLRSDEVELIPAS